MIEAKVFMGSKEVENLEIGERISPYSGEVVSTFPICGAEDAKKALNVAKDAFEETKKSPLSQRVAWLRDVAKRLKEQKELFIVSDITFTLVDTKGFKVVDQKRIYSKIEAKTLDAKGGVRALNEALNRMSRELVVWLDGVCR